MTVDSLDQRSRQVVWHPCTQMRQLEDFPPLEVARAAGVWLYDRQGKPYLDSISSWWVNLFGHANPRIGAALCEQFATVDHVMLAGCTHEPVVALSERLCRLSGLDHAFYASDGASATEIALKMSFHAWRNLGRPEKAGFISLRQGYHGETIGALAVTDVAIFRDVYQPMLQQTRQVMSPDWRLAEDGETPEAYALRAAADLESCLQQHHATTAALIVEPLVQCAGGMAMYHPVWLARARALCDQYGVHLIADEIAVGFGRTGTLFAVEQADIRPDLMCLSKGITGGSLPLSAVLASDSIYQAFYADDVRLGFLHSHSYTGNPLACRAALAVLDIFDSEDVLAGNRERAERFDRLCQPLREHPLVRHFRRTGMIWAFDLAIGDRRVSRDIYRLGLERGVLLRPIGQTVYFMPPYVITDADMQFLVQATLAVLAAL